jgi:dCTP deaminase
VRTRPWDDWIPGVLSKKQVGRLAEENYIRNASVKAGDYDYSSLDVRISEEAYQLTRGCVKPYERGYLQELLKKGLAKPLSLDPEGAFALTRRTSYVFRLQEQITELRNTRIYGSATAKSSIGRMDVLARLIVDGMNEYEGFDPRRIASGDLFLEVTPMTFNVRVKPGTSLTQLRLYKGAPRESLIQGEALLETVFEGDESNQDATLSVDLTADRIAGHDVCALSVDLQDPASKAIELWSSPAQPGQEDLRPKPWENWRFEFADPLERLRVVKDRFYIIRSHEKIRLPEGIAVYCRASDETIGEMRIHYAGFVHPLFGNERGDGKRGTPLIFEVRGHDIDVSLRHREKMARLEFYRMSQDAMPEENRQDDPYREQTLKLSKFFAAWPDAVNCTEDGIVTPK